MNERKEVTFHIFYSVWYKQFTQIPTEFSFPIKSYRSLLSVHPLFSIIPKFKVLVPRYELLSQKHIMIVHFICFTQFDYWSSPPYRINPIIKMVIINIEASESLSLPEIMNIEKWLTEKWRSNWMGEMRGNHERIRLFISCFFKSFYCSCISIHFISLVLSEVFLWLLFDFHLIFWSFAFNETQ
jgi:hypothetical protein